jgi:hypothetical protein
LTVIWSAPELELVDIHFAIAIVVSAWAAGFFAGTLFTFGMIEVVTGRMVVNPQRLNWSVGEVRVRGMAFAIGGLLIGTYSLINFLSLLVSWYQIWALPPWWYATQLAWVPIVGIAPMTSLLLEQHHKKRWPFNRSRTQASLD